MARSHQYLGSRSGSAPTSSPCTIHMQISIDDQTNCKWKTDNCWNPVRVSAVPVLLSLRFVGGGGGGGGGRTS